jgi:hypothetical protein
MIDLRAQRPKGRGGGEDILAFQQAGDLGFAQRKRAEHQGAMGHRLVAGCTDASLQPVHGTGDQLGRSGVSGQGGLHGGKVGRKAARRRGALLACRNLLLTG